ncbi:glycosyl transferase family protein [Deinococcus pimensis]|uniref:glycosyl transferase family protein n=1 Tax=Deinococcus pimensis TaxID=309888 RepID=UPI000693FBF1|nr:glycosyl transferase family protein [Deinococcus pimensis]
MTALVTVLLGAVLVLFILSSFDDLVLDVVYLLSRRAVRASNVPASVLREDRPLRLAVLVPAWREAGVVGEMLRATLDLADYPRGHVEVFVGIYPNDDATRADVEAARRTHPNVHVVVNPRPGPTCKAQNLNVLLAAVGRYEEERGEPFEGICVHDAEDAVHPFTLRLYSALLARHDAVQLPVLAVREAFSWRRAPGWLVSRTYADEFAQRHLHEVPVREHLGLFVPGAGTGFALRREVVAWLAARGPVFDESSLTEDYELTWRLWHHGFGVHFHVQRAMRVDDRGRTRVELVAVHERFPTGLGAAVRQKGRWTYGICMQTPTTRHWRELSWWDRLALWHDRKGKYTNLLHLVGYPASLYGVLAPSLGWPSGSGAVLVPLATTVLALTAERLVMRFLAVREVYGTGEALLGAALPPLVPLRWLVASVVNTLAALRAWRLHAGAVARGTPRWDKTERRSYVPESLLRALRCRLGDRLLFLGEVGADALGRAVRTGDGRIGERLVAQGALDEETVARHVAGGRGVPWVDLNEEAPDFALVPMDASRRWLLAPLSRRAGAVVVASPLVVDEEAWAGAVATLEPLLGAPVVGMAASRAQVLAALEAATEAARPGEVPRVPGWAS